MMDILQQIVNYSESIVYNADGTVWKPSHPIILRAEMANVPSIGGNYGGWWIIFRFEECLDKTKTIIFSKDQSNVLRIRRTKTAPEANIIQMGGSGDGADRVFAHSGDEPSRAIYGDREGFRSFSGFKRDTEPTHQQEIEELKSQLYDELRKATSQTVIEAEVLDKEGMRYHSDWFLGDKVKVETPISSDDVIIREVSGTVDANGENIQARLGTAPAPLYGLNDKKKTSNHNGWIQDLFKRTQGE